MIKTFRHKGLERFFLKGDMRGIQPHHAAKLQRVLARLDTAKRADDVNVPGWHLHSLKGQEAGHFSVWINGNWRITFTFQGEDVMLVNYLDYH